MGTLSKSLCNINVAVCRMNRVFLVFVIMFELICTLFFTDILSFVPLANINTTISLLVMLVVALDKSF